VNIGREIISAVLKDNHVQTLLDAGFSNNWLFGSNTGSEVIFAGADKQAYAWILSHYRRFRKVPTLSLFRENFPEESLRLSDDNISLSELTELAEKKVNSYLVADIIGRVIDLHDKNRISDAVTLLRNESERISNGIKYRPSKADDLSDPSFDISTMLDRTIEPGIPFGISKIDEEFFGFLPGQLITLMGRQKSGKSWSTLLSAVNAWKEGYTVLFFSVEMDTSILRDRLYCIGAGVSPSRMRRGRLLPAEKRKVIEFHDQFINTSEEEGESRFFISRKRSLITTDDIREEIARYNPNIVYIDGFSFMLDKKTNRMTSDWQANENVADELKGIAMEEEIVIFVNTQVQEKQYVAKHGIEARSIASGTGLLKASDLIMGQDKEADCITYNCVYSRFEYFDNVVVELNWEHMTFSEIEPGEKLKEMGV
jgi:hypothetical protein